MFKKHYSDCSLHDLPARFPMKCSCGGIKDDKQHVKVSNRFGYSLFAALENFVQLWKARIIWKCENHETLGRFLLEVARHSKLNLRRNHSRQCAAQRRADDSCNKS